MSAEGVAVDQQPLVFGTQIIAELRGAPRELLSEEATARSTAAALIGFLEGDEPAEDAALEVVRDPAGGLSVGASAPDSGVVIHAFPDHKRLVLRLYSSRAVRPFEAVAEFRKWYPSGKLELHVSGRFRRLGSGPVLLRELAGERGYAALRLGATPAVPGGA